MMEGKLYNVQLILIFINAPNFDDDFNFCFKPKAGQIFQNL